MLAHIGIMGAAGLIIESVNQSINITTACPGGDNWTVNCFAKNVSGETLKVYCVVDGVDNLIYDDVLVAGLNSHSAQWGARDQDPTTNKAAKSRVEVWRDGNKVFEEETSPENFDVEDPATCPGDFN